MMYELKGARKSEEEGCKVESDEA